MCNCGCDGGVRVVQSDVALWLLVHAFQRLQIIHSDSLSASRATLHARCHIAQNATLSRSSSPLSLSLALRHGIPRNRTQQGDYALEYLSFPRDRIRRRAHRRAIRRGAKTRSLRRNQVTNRKMRSLSRGKKLCIKIKWERKTRRERERDFSIKFRVVSVITSDCLFNYLTMRIACHYVQLSSCSD